MFLSFPQARELLLRQVINHLDNTAIGEGGDDLESAMGLDPDTYGFVFISLFHAGILLQRIHLVKRQVSPLCLHRQRDAASRPIRNGPSIPVAEARGFTGRFDNIARNTKFERISCTMPVELIPSNQPQKGLEVRYFSCNHPATSGAKYVIIISAPALLIPVSTSITTRRSSIQPLCAAALIIENSPLTL